MLDQARAVAQRLREWESTMALFREAASTIDALVNEAISWKVISERNAEACQDLAAEVERLRGALEFCAGTSYASDANEVARATLGANI